jgi:hypothetical protein
MSHKVIVRALQRISARLGIGIKTGCKLDRGVIVKDLHSEARVIFRLALIIIMKLELHDSREWNVDIVIDDRLEE